MSDDLKEGAPVSKESINDMERISENFPSDKDNVEDQENQQQQQQQQQQEVQLEQEQLEQEQLEQEQLEQEQLEQEQLEQEQGSQYIDFLIITPDNLTIKISNVSIIEPVGALKQSLSEFVETAFYSSFSLALKHDEEYKKLFEFQEISTFVNKELVQETLYIVVEDYDVKQARSHIKKLRDVISNPPMIKGAITTSNTKSDSKSETKTKSKSNENKKDIKTTLTTEEILAMISKDNFVILSPKLHDFYREVLFRTGKNTNNHSTLDSNRIHMTEVLKSVTLSAWNPPPSQRRLMGDLLYIEVVVSEENIYQITATSTGFYINNSTRIVFDPKPSSTHPLFSHELFHLIFQASPMVRNAWNSIIKQVEITSKSTIEPGALDLIASVYLQGKGDHISLNPQWNFPSEDVLDMNTESSKVISSYSVIKKHTSDIGRLQDDLTDNFGIEERGTSREWNDEIQPIRDTNPTSMQERVTKAKYCHKIITEFVEASKIFALAIMDGHISPLNFGEVETSLIYVYNGIFMSRAVDTKDTFRVCSGEEACRKAASLDLNNQRRIMSVGIDGISTLLTTLVDIRGERFVAQSIIPGVLSSGANSARLVYGVLQEGKRIVYKTHTQSILEKMRKSLFLKASTVPIIAQTTSYREQSHQSNPESGVDIHHSNSNTSSTPIPLVGNFLSQLETEKGAPISVDDEGEVITDPETKSMLHIGPIEGKLLTGTDARIYALDMLRLTPRDANYVKGDKGTKLISSDHLDGVKEELFAVYVLRHELIMAYIQTKISNIRQKIVIDAVTAQKEAKQALQSPKVPETSTLSDSPELKKDYTDDTTTTTTKNSNNSESNQVEKDEISNDFQFTEEITTKYNNVTPESIGLELNPNVFLSLYDPTIGADAKDIDTICAEVEKDEELARELARFLYNQVLPNITDQVRLGDPIIYDNESIVEMLHTNGINLRYLGQLARLAKLQEQEDINVIKEGKQRIQPMPVYWLEMLEIEMLARATKHLLRRLYVSNKRMQSAPSATIVALLNYIFGNESENTVDSSSISQNNSQNVNQNNSSIATQTTSQILSKSAKKRMKAKATNLKPVISSVVPELIDATSGRKSTLEELSMIIRERFCYEPVLIQLSSTQGSIFISNRISKLTLLRRICQINGLRIVTRDYDLNSSSSSSTVTTNKRFVVEDLIAIIPKVKSCEPEVPIPDLRNLIFMSRSLLQERNLQAAFELSNEASHYIEEVVGATHRESLLSIDQMTSILVGAGDYFSALSTALKALTIAVQVYGLDSSETLQHHIQVANIYIELKHYELAIKHLQSAKYLVMLLAGDHHTELSTIYSLFATIAKELGDLELAAQCYQVARAHVGDLNKHSMITEYLAEVYLKLNRLDEALKEQRISYNVFEGILGESNPKTNDSKDRMEKYRRAVTIRNVELAKEKRDLEEKNRLEAQTRMEANQNSNGNTNGNHDSSGLGYKKSMNKKSGSKRK